MTPYTVKINVTWQRLMILENASARTSAGESEEARTDLAMEKNVPLLQQIVELRDKIAHQLGYAIVGRLPD